jgi:hypothetical protein
MLICPESTMTEAASRATFAVERGSPDPLGKVGRSVVVLVNRGGRAGAAKHFSPRGTSIPMRERG